MTYWIRKFVRGVTSNLGTGATVLFTCPALTHVRIDTFNVSNQSSGTLIFTGYFVAYGDTAATSNELCEESVSANDQFSGPTGFILAPGDTIQGKGDSAGLNVWIGAEVVEPGPDFA